MKGIGFYEHGDLDVLQPIEVPDPIPGPGEVVIRVEYCSLNHLDIFVRKGWPGLDLPKPHIPGSDVSGTIAAVGEGVTGWRVGQHVVANPGLWCGECEYCLRGEQSMCIHYGILGETTAGCYAEYVKVPARNLLEVPDGFPMDKASAACLVSLTAWRMLKRAGLRAGETVAVVGAGGGVNTMAIQIAKLAGARVFAATSTPDKMEQARALAKRLKGYGISAIYTSDLSRAFETARIVGEEIGIEPIPDRRLREIDLGGWSGLTRDEVIARYPEEWKRWSDGKDIDHAGGESFGQFWERVREVINEIIERHRGETVLIVAHGGVTRILVSKVLGLGFREMFTDLPPMANTGITEVVVRGDEVEVLSVADDAHLKEARIVGKTTSW